MMKPIIAATAFLLIPFAVFAQPKVAQKPVNDEIIYHVFERSFYDSNGDNNGDLNGVRLKLDYLQQLGVTAILFTPLYESVFYHNYFSSNFRKIDPQYGNMRDLVRLIKALHSRGMKIYLDMETQYITDEHEWWKSALGNLKSPYRNYIFFDDSAHTKPAPIIFGIRVLTGYNGVSRGVTTVNLNEPGVQRYNYQLFKYFMDPNNDGRFDDGVDGFRLDHMMDNLDNSGKMPHLFDTFWSPLLSKLRQVNPKVKIVAEQADWGSLGVDYFTRGGVDRVFGFRLMMAVRSMKKKELIRAADSTFGVLPAGKQVVVCIENHDLTRFASEEKSDQGKLRTGAAINLLIGGIPSIYYGQELGMTGAKSNAFQTDANDIPDRQAFEWYASNEGPGMAYWYRNKDTWAILNTEKPNDGISLQEQRSDPSSLWNYYRALIRLRRTNPVLINGLYQTIVNNNDQVFTFIRRLGNSKILVAINLSGQMQQASVTDIAVTAKLLFGKGKLSAGAIDLPAYGVAVWRLN